MHDRLSKFVARDSGTGNLDGELGSCAMVLTPTTRVLPLLYNIIAFPFCRNLSWFRIHTCFCCSVWVRQVATASTCCRPFVCLSTALAGHADSYYFILLRLPVCNCVASGWSPMVTAICTTHYDPPLTLWRPLLSYWYNYKVSLRTDFAELKGHCLFVLVSGYVC